MALKINEYDKELFDKINEDFKTISGTISNSEIVPFHESVEQCVAFLSDYNSKDADIYTSYFIDGAFQKVASNSICFKIMPITEKIETYPQPLILISDQSELDTNTKQIVSSRCEKGFWTFPVIIFPNDFFQLVYGESSSYLPIIESYEKASESKVIPFREGDIQQNSLYVSSYILYIACFARIEILFRILEHLKLTEVKIIEELLSLVKGKQNSRIKRLSYLVRLKAIRLYTNKLNSSLYILETDKAQLCAALNGLRENYDKHINELINGVAVSNISSFALKIDLQYGKLAEYIKRFLNKIQFNNENLYGIYSDKIKAIANNTLENVSANSVKMSLIGTFSSGKTTLINTFLGNKALHTSVQHNTAVLMKLDYANQENEESCDFIYKDKLKWSILKPASKQTLYTNTTGHKIRILSVADRDGSYEIIYETIQPKGKKFKTAIRKTGELNIKKGSILKPDESFLKEKPISMDTANSTPATKSEIELLIKMLQKNEFTNPVLKYSDNTQKTNVKDIINFLKRIHKIAPLKSDTDIKFQKVLGEFPEIEKNKKFSLRRVVFVAKMNKKNKTINLNKENWERIFGKSKAFANRNFTDERPDSEMPECYMLIKELHLHIHSEFLQYCAVTDTPGFGSVTEEHDATTERYIRDEPGRLLVMIAVNAKTEDGKYADLINNIENIYNNYRINEKKDVTFILNCFTSSANIKNLQNTINKVIRTLKNKGFYEKNIFVCDMKKAITKNERPLKMLGYPSYQAFHDFCVNDIITIDLNNRYNKIYENWRKFFKDMESDIEAKILQYQFNLTNVESRREELNGRLSAIRKTGEELDFLKPLLDEIKEDFQCHYNNIVASYQNTRKGIFESKRLNEMIKCLDMAQKSITFKNEDSIECVKDLYDSCISKVNYYSISNNDSPFIDVPSTPLVVLTYEKIKNRLEEANRETCWYNKNKQKDYYSKLIQELIQTDCDTSCERVQEYNAECKKKFIEYKNLMKKELEQELSSLESLAKIKQEIRNLEKIKVQFQMIENEFKRIKFFCKK